MKAESLIRLATVFMVALAVTASANESPVRQLVVIGAWTNPEGETVARSVEAVEMSCQKMARRILVETPENRRLILESQWIPSTGVKTLRLIDDSSGWWMELREVSLGRFELPSADVFGNSLWLQERMLEAREHGMTAQLEARGTQTLEISVEPGESIGPRLAAAARTRGLPVRWKQDFDPGLQQALRFLRRFDQGPQGGPSGLLGEFDGVLEVLQTMPPPESEPKPEGPELHHEVLEAAKGLEILPEAQKLASRFQSLSSPVDLLEGLHAPADGGCSQD